MSQPGRKSGINISGEILGHLRKKSRQWHGAADILEAWPFQQELTEEQARSALSHLVSTGRVKREGRGKNAKWKYDASKDKAVKAEFGTAIHEQVEAYIHDTQMPQVAMDVRASQIADEAELAGEPHGTFEIIGNLADVNTSNYKGVVVRITSPGFSDRPHLLTEL